MVVKILNKLQTILKNIYKIIHMNLLTPEQKLLFMNYYILTPKQINDIRHMRKICGMTVEEVARKFTITQADVNRIVTPPKKPLLPGWTMEDRQRQWLAGQKRKVTVKKQNDELRDNKRQENIIQILDCMISFNLMILSKVFVLMK